MSLIELQAYLPSSDLSGAPDATFATDDQLVDAGFNPVLWGEGDGFLEIHADDPDAQYLQRRGFIRAVRTDTGEGLFWWILEEGSVKLLSQRGRSEKVIHWDGRGMLYYLDRYKLGQAVWASGQPHRGSIDVIDYWTWLNEPMIAILTRFMEEGQEDTRADFLDKLAYDFSRTQDSNGNGLTDVTEYQVRIGTGGLTLATDAMRQGNLLQVLATQPPTLQAFRALTEYRTDRTSATFASGKVRFEAGENIATELPHKIVPLRERTHTLTRRKDGQYATEDLNGSGEPYMEFEEVPHTSDPAAVEAWVGQSHLQRQKQSLMAVIRHKIGPGGASGADGYFPSPAGDYWLGDLVTVHVGTDEYDLNEQALEVAGIRYFLRGADWMIEAQLGAQIITSTGAPVNVPGAGPTVPGPGCMCPQLCEADVDGSQPTLAHSWEFGSTGLCSEHADHEIMNGGLGTGISGGWMRNVFAATGHITGNADRFSVVAGTVYTVATQLDEYDDDGHTGPAVLTISWRNGAGTEISTTDVFSVSGGQGAGEASVTVPPTAVEAYWYVHRPAAGVHHLLGVNYVRFYLQDGTTGVERDGPVELVGTSSKAARCDHNHLVETLLTEETDDALVLKPDGAGGVEWGTAAGSGGATVGCDISRSAAQSIPQNASTAVQWATENLDEAAFWSSGQNTRFVAPSDGWYSASGYVKWDANTGLGRQIMWRRNSDSAIFGRNSIPADSIHNDPYMAASAIVKLTAGQYLECLVFQNDEPGGINVTTGRATVVKLP